MHFDATALDDLMAWSFVAIWKYDECIRYAAKRKFLIYAIFCYCILMRALKLWSLTRDFILIELTSKMDHPF